MQIRELFASVVTRDIPPVVYFHEQSPDRLASEVGEYIVTGGFPKGHPHRERVPKGIHEHYVGLLRAILEDLLRPGGPDLPASWISGFYGSGKSSFAKLLGLALDGVALPGGKSLAAAWLERDMSPLRDELVEAWEKLRAHVDPLAVVFDIGGLARENEHIHSVVVRQVAVRLGYSTEPLVAEYELKLERDGRFKEFEEAARKTLGAPWSEVKGRALVEDHFSRVLHVLDSDHFPDPMSWISARAGTTSSSTSPTEATKALADMLAFRAPGRTLFIVVDEVSQYIHQDEQRMLRLQSFVSELGQRLRGKAWLLVTGQQKLEEADDTNVLGKLKDRFKAKLRVHLDATNIRDVVHKRLLHKTPAGDKGLRQLFGRHRNDLRLFAYQAGDITEEDFVEVYPMLPGHIDLLLRITTALRTRSTRSQGDDQGIRGLLQLLGELFRSQKLAERPVGSLVTLDSIYDVQHSALDADIELSMSRIAEHCSSHHLGDLHIRAAKAVALLQLLQESEATSAELVSRCLYDRLDRGSIQGDVETALEALRAEGLLTYSTKEGYRIQSASGEEWERERRDIAIPREDWLALVRETLKNLVETPPRPMLGERPFPWHVLFSDGQRANDVSIASTSEPACVTVDVRLLSAAERASVTTWVNRSAEADFHHRILWIAGGSSEVETGARDLARSRAMVKRYQLKRDSLTPDKKRLLLDEEHNAEELELRLREKVDAAWLDGSIYFRGQQAKASDSGASFASVLSTVASKFLPSIYPYFVAIQVSPQELMQLLEPSLDKPAPKFVEDLGILSLDAGRYVPSCHGEAPRKIDEFLRAEHGASGETLQKEFCGPPYGYASSVVRASLAGLLRASKVKIETADGLVITAARDAGTREVFEKDRDFKRATFRYVTEEVIDVKDRNRICGLFEKRLGASIDRENAAIADTVGERFPRIAGRLRTVVGRLERLPALPSERSSAKDRVPPALRNLETALEAAMRNVRQTEETVRAVKRHFDALNDGLEQLDLIESELSDDAVARIRAAYDVWEYQVKQLEAYGALGDPAICAEVETIETQLASDRAWRDAIAIENALEAIKGWYRETRRRILADQLARKDALQAAIKSRQGFATLTAEQSHHVLRPLSDALSITNEDSVSPSLVELESVVARELDRAAEDANRRLDELLSERPSSRPIRRVRIGVRNREIATMEALEAFLEEIRARVEPELRSGHSVRLVEED